MKVRVELTSELSSNKVWIGDKTLSEILSTIYSKTTTCVQDISIERQKEIPNFQDIDAPLYAILNLIEEITNH